MKTICSLLTVLILTFTEIVYPQSPAQVIRGKVIDKQSRSTLPGANIIIIGSDPLKGTSTDAEGQFRLTGITPGRYDLKISFIGYEEAIIPNIIVTAGKEAVIEITLEESVKALNEFVVRSGKEHQTINRMTTVSASSFSMEEVNRYSGGRQDPSRLASNFAGVSTPNDSRNDIVIRGNSPTGVLWRIEGMNIPNPNHFTTMGTTGGPVSALNPNVLDNSDFLTSAFPASYGNANAGVFDIHLRNGNSERGEYMIQMGALTGLEAMAEGPLKKGTDASYLAAYRYSFTGLSQKLGIPIGTSATPFYQDLTFKINSPETKAGRFTLFGIGGISHIDFLHDKINAGDIFVNSNQDTYSRSKIFAVGLVHYIRIGKNSYVKTILGVSYSEGGYDLDTIQKDNTPLRVGSGSTVETRYMVTSFFNHKFNSRFSMQTGIQVEIYDLDLLLKDRFHTTYWKYLLDYKGTTSLPAAYAEGKYKVTEKLSLTAGLRSQYLTLNGSASLEPRAGLRFQVSPKNIINAGYGYNSQMQTMPVYFFRELMPDGTYDESNQKLGFTNSQHFVVSWETMPFKEWRIKTEIYYQLLSHIPVSKETNSFSMLNEGASFNMTQEFNLTNKGTGTNYGIELTIEKYFSHGYYLLLTGSLYQAKYKGSDQVERNTAFNGIYVCNILAGKEFRLGKTKRNSISFDVRYSQAGGRYYTPIDLEASRAKGEEVLMGDAYAWSMRYPDFLRLDVKGGITLNSKKRRFSQTFYLDIQNVTNHNNVFMQQYNTSTKEVGILYQIGFYPNFVYKIQF